MTNETSRDWAICDAVDRYRAPRNEGDERTLSDFLADVGVSIVSYAATPPDDMDYVSPPGKNPKIVAASLPNPVRDALEELLAHWEKIPMWNAKEVNASVERARAALAAPRESFDRNAVIEECAKIADPWAGFWPQDDATDTDRAVIKVRLAIAKAIRGLLITRLDRLPDSVDPNGVRNEDGT